jgi:hypothetical protein
VDVEELVSSTRLTAERARRALGDLTSWGWVQVSEGGAYGIAEGRSEDVERLLR